MLTDLHDLRWQYRILVINEPSQPQTLVTRLWANAAAFDERRLAWFVLLGDEVQTNYAEAIAGELRQNIRSRFSPGSREVLLIGLDGGVKARDDQVDLEALYATIDAMPMRRAERRE